MQNTDKSKRFKVSFSALETFKTCPRKYYYGYVLKLPKIDRPWFTFGNFNHLILEKFFKYIIFFKKRNRNYDKKELLYRAFNSALRKFKSLHAQFKVPALTPKQIKETKEILKKFYSRIDVVEPNVLAVEKEFTIDLSEDIYLVGYIDRIDKEDDNTYRIVDYKTSKEAYKIDKNKQLDIYAIGFSKAVGLTKEARIYKQLDFIKINKQTDPYALHNQDRNDDILEELRETSAGIKEKVELHRENTEAWTPIDNDFCWACDFKDRCYKDRGITESLFND